MKLILKAVAGLVALVVVLLVGLYLYTRDEYPVPATVVDDPSLPAREVLGVRLHAESFGPQDGPAVIVLHGGPGGDYRSLLPLAALSEDGYRVTFYDQRGAGLSERVDSEALTLTTHLDELDALGKALSPEAPVILIGHSWGAMLGAAYLGRYPDRVAQAVLIEPGFLSAEEANDFMMRMQGMMKTPAFLWHATLTWFESLHVSGPDADAPTDYLFGQMMHWFAGHPDNSYHCPGEPWDSPAWRTGARAGQAVQAQATQADLDSLGDVAAFTGPVLLMSGACDSWLGTPLQERHLALFANARHVAVDDAGHDVIDDQPEATLAEIRAFLD